MRSSLCHIELELAPEPGHPFGDREHLYHLYLPLLPDGQVDASAVKVNRKCRARRLCPGEGEASGTVGVDAGGQLTLHYDRNGSQEGRVGFRQTANRFLVGQSVPIAEANGEAHIYQVIAVRPA